ncbi:MAG: hypothetical protein ACE5HC_12225 [Candidatus Binatia bacterium]
MDERLRSLPLTKQKAAQVLTERGEDALRELAGRFSELRVRFRDPPLFNLAVAEWLAECFPVKADQSFYQKISSYLEEEGEPSVLEDNAQVPLFREAATLWRIVLITQDASSITDEYSATDIWLYQEIVLNAAGLLSIKKTPKGIGPWLFLGPFKLLAAWKPEHWGSMEHEHLLYPFAKDEVSALSFFKEREADWLGKNVERILKIEEQNFSTASATIAMAQDVQKELARSAGSHLLHINAGLRHLGSSLLSGNPGSCLQPSRK